MSSLMLSITALHTLSVLAGNYIACKTKQKKIKSMKSDLFLEWGWTKIIPLSTIQAIVFVYNST